MNQETQTKRSTSPNKNSIRSVVTPKPLDFDAFIPWVCHEFEISCDIFVNRITKDDYSQYKDQNRLSKTKSNLQQKNNNQDKKDHTFPAVDKGCNFNRYLDKCIPLTSYYDSKGCLVEIAIVGSPVEISRKLFIAVSLCVPFHPSLAKFTIRRRGLSFPGLFELSKLLARSNITEVCLEDCRLPGGSHELLLGHACNLKNLSLRRLNITDTDCVGIAKKLDIGEAASKTLLTLDLAFNKITDEGAKALGEMLRRNRSLLHLNLCSNQMTDVGAGYILGSLTMFSITEQERRDCNLRKIEYFMKKMAAYEKNKDLLARQKEETTEVENMERRKSKKTKSQEPVETITELAEKLTMAEIGEFLDVFRNDHVKSVNKILYCIGNLCLGSLNLAYNNLTYISVRKIYEILIYQSNSVYKTYKKFQATGLVRIIFEGNYIPNDCPEIQGINVLINKLLSSPSDTKHVRLSSWNNETRPKSRNIKTKH